MSASAIALKDQIRYPELLDSMRDACQKIAPVWPLENFVAVNPYLGMTDQNFETVAGQLAMTGGIRMTLPRSFYLGKIREGKIARTDLAQVLYRRFDHKVDVEAFVRKLEKEENVEQINTLPTLIDIADHATGQDWTRFVISRISAWAASYFDAGQANWKTADLQDSIFQSWKTEAGADLTPEISGLKGFRKKVRNLSGEPLEAVSQALDILGLSNEELPAYFHKLLLRVGGWAAFTARLDWDLGLQGKKGGHLIEFLAVLTCWEACLFQCLEDAALQGTWQRAKKALADSQVQKRMNAWIRDSIILQEAYDTATQREIIEAFSNRDIPEKMTRPKAQAIFCIDVRSEVYRRNLEMVDRGIETLGFAGFFAFPINYVPIAHDKGEAQCPVLINPGPTIREVIPDNQQNGKAVQGRIKNYRLREIWKAFRSGAVSCFSFVSPLGLSYLPKLVSDSLGFTRPVPHPDQIGLNANMVKGKSISLESHENSASGIPLEQRIEMARNALKAMSLTEGFADLVLIVGHGSSSVNNPHATGLDCGACGGHTGESNARTAAAVLNDEKVRESLKSQGMAIPDSTFFLACLHDTTTDEVAILNEQDVPAGMQEALMDLKRSLAQAGHAARTERAVRLGAKGNVDKALLGRSKDWSEVRPEWGLAGCHGFVVAPRTRTQNIKFDGRVFLHSYEWKKDRDFSVLELIMTAPMVVTSWINLQYYASVVDNDHFGSGNKTLHNVTAGVGVLEGFSGDLRVGLPMQSVHDGEKYQHEPARLNVIIEAPIDAMNSILEKHQSVRDLCDNEWIHLLAMDSQGTVSHRYTGDLQWEEIRSN